MRIIPAVILLEIKLTQCTDASRNKLLEVNKTVVNKLETGDALVSGRLRDIGT